MNRTARLKSSFAFRQVAYLSLSANISTTKEAIHRKEQQTIYAVVRRGKPNPGSLKELARRIQNSQMPTIRTIPGFISFTLVSLGNDEGASLSLFETQEAAAEANRFADEWVRQNLADLSPGPPEISEGEVLIHVTK